MTETPALNEETKKAQVKPFPFSAKISLSIVGILLVVHLVIFSTLFMPDFLRRGMQEDLAKGEGTLASARIVSVSETGRWYSKRPIMHFSVKVLPAGAAEFSTEFDQEVGLFQFGQFQPGAQIQVRYNPAEHDEVVIVYESVR